MCSACRVTFVYTMLMSCVHELHELGCCGRGPRGGVSERLDGSGYVGLRISRAQALYFITFWFL